MTDELTARLARDWQYDAGLEQVIANGQPTDPRVTIAVGLYLDGKAAAKAHGYDTTGRTPRPPTPDPLTTITQEMFQ